MTKNLDALKVWLAFLIFEESSPSWIEDTSIPFQLPNTLLCDRAIDHFRGKTDVRITSASSSDIQKIEVEYLRDNVVRRKMPPPNLTPIVDPTTLAAVASTHTLYVEQAGISIPSSTAGPTASIFVSISIIVAVVRPLPLLFLVFH
ncbi:hypothetical protein R3W88_014650 [Solanum pinnatisectum]|uniref:Uncharacterized protein n=1 Tax=Solanum pinnatisectum TaxID=50273 RepID=A0AAV9KTH2_9SOLN|nr:hypothetical protein R3W88_014650 [Solanum pinnatisectum]